MKRQSEPCFSFLALILIAGQIRAENETLADRFLGSPLLILAALFIIVLIAFLYHKIRK
jgi:hypothetical protein